jgi:hypothetical protein
MGPSKWMNGLCPIYAETLHSILGTGEFVGLFDHPSLPPRHVYLVHNSLAYDFANDGVTEPTLVAAQPVSHACAERGPELKSIYQGVPPQNRQDAYFYDGPEKQRWREEAETLIKKKPFIQHLLRSQGASAITTQQASPAG